MRNATDKQVALMRRLRDEKHIDPDRLVRLDSLIASHDLGVLEMTTASAAIDLLTQMPDKLNGDMSRTGLDIGALETGRYAVGDVLIRIDKPNDGKWLGWVFVKNGSEYTDERFGSQRPAHSYYGKYEDLLATVLDDPLAAMQHYGQITNHCGVCGRTLEDDVSVQRGIGPVCWEKIA